jgi:hypothetical protein
MGMKIYMPRLAREREKEKEKLKKEREAFGDREENVLKCGMQ